MCSPSRVESIFFAALEKKTAAERADYLDQACGGDAPLRLRVEQLLEAHPLAVDFLAEPAVDRHRFNAHDATEEQTCLAPTSGPEASPGDPRTKPDMRETADRERGERMMARESKIPPPAKSRIPEALDRLIELYTATNKPDEVKKWQAERAKYPGAKPAKPVN
jgi:hypothetical protein